MSAPFADWPDSTFWEFSLRVYGQPEVEATCLTLQDELGLDVNLVLLATWLSGGGRRLDGALAGQLRCFADHIQSNVIRPLRQARRGLKAQSVPPEFVPFLAERRRTLAAIELEFERLEQVQLAALVSVLPDDEAAASESLFGANFATLYPDCQLPARAQAVFVALIPTARSRTAR